MESIDMLLMLKARATARLFFRSLLALDASFGDPCGVAMGVAAVWVIIGGGLRGPIAGGCETSFTLPVLSSLVMDTEGGRPSIFFSVEDMRIKTN